MTKKKMKYADYLKLPEWQSKRKEILKRDHYRCRYCLLTEGLHVHHLWYDPDKFRLPWDYHNEILITACYKCHREIHDGTFLTEESHILKHPMGANYIINTMLATNIYFMCEYFKAGYSVNIPDFDCIAQEEE